MENAAYKILIADNQPLTAAGLMYYLSQRSDVEIMGQIDHRDHLVKAVHEHQPDLLIADYNIPGYITIDDLQHVRKISDQTNMLIISSDNNKRSILDVLQLGVKGYLTKDSSKDEIMMGIQSTMKGEKFFCHQILNIIMEKHFSPVTESADTTSLTVRETEILKHLASGRSTQQIADDLYLSPHTVHTHRKSIIRKLNIKSPTQFVIYAMDLGLIKPR